MKPQMNTAQQSRNQKNLLSVVSQASQVPRSDVVKRVSQSHFAEWEMVAIGLSVRRDVDQLMMAGFVRECAEKAMSEILPVRKQALESDRARDRAIVEKEAETSTRWERKP